MDEYTDGELTSLGSIKKRSRARMRELFAIADQVVAMIHKKGVKHDEGCIVRKFAEELFQYD